MKITLDSKPRLRWPLDVNRFEHQGKQVVSLSDPHAVASEPIVLLEAILPVVSRFDGSRTVQSIVDEGQPYGMTAELVLGIANELATRHFLHSDAVDRKWEEIQAAFRELPVREASHAGLVYPKDPAALEKQLDEYIDGVSVAPGLLPEAEPIVGLMLPHIDYHRGWKTYGAGFHALRKMARPDVIFLIGTAHMGGESLFHLTSKDFATPYGPVPTSREVVDLLSKRYGAERAFRNEILHKNEHSLELQMPFIAHRFRGEGFPEIVPILVGSFHQCVLDQQPPIENGEIQDFIGALAEAAQTLVSAGKRVLFLAGVDMAHVGQHFGDVERVSDRGLEEIESRDQALLQALLASDEDALFAHIAEDADRRRICGFPSLYAMLHAMKQANMKLRGHLLEYRQAVDPESDCIVTFASAAWTES